MARFGRTYVKLGLVRPVKIVGLLLSETDSDTEGLTDSLSSIQAHVQPISESEGLTDSLAFVQTEISSFEDSVGLTDSLIITLGVPYETSDTEGLTDNLTVSLGNVVTPGDSLGLTDSLILETIEGPPPPITSGPEGSLVLGPATLYIGALGAVEPAAGDVGSAPDDGVWTDLGGLLGGVDLTIDQEWEDIEVRQLPTRVARRMKKRRLSVKTQLAEPTLANLGYALNDTPGTSAGTGWEQYAPTDQTDATPLTYVALLVDGWAPGFNAITHRHKRRRLILRKCLSIDNVSLSYSKDGQSVYTVTWSCHYVDGSTPPFRVIDEA
jgi:hypothetical protein